ncbi:MAG: hypothetical protein FJ149_06235 [Euryarchaeota archaeon]|nr:hypothetical protein [Euryarchaeota archaeon]
MPRRTTWVYSPDSGGRNIPDDVKKDVSERVTRVAEEKFKGRYIRLGFRFKGQFCYIDAFTEPEVPRNWPPRSWPGTREEHIERLRKTPTHLCRLRYFGPDRWGFAFYTYSNERYQLSVYPDGEFLGKPEGAFLVSARMYLSRKWII